MSKRTAIVTGICGQDGSYLAELLLEKDYRVVGLKRRTSSNSLGCSSHLEGQIEVEEGDLCDLPSLCKLTNKVKADEFYNLAAQSHVGTSFKQPIYTYQVNAMGVINCLEAIRNSGIHTKFYQASTSELFGGTGEGWADETHQMSPKSPYAESKLAAYWAVRNYRDGYKMFACNGILFNHESPRRGPEFVTRKITRAAARIVEGLQEFVELGNVQAKRDWGHAKDYVKGMWLMLQQGWPDDYVLAMGDSHTVREFADIAFEEVGLEFQDHLKVNADFFRPCEVEILKGNSEKAKKALGWKPEYTFEGMVTEMVQKDLVKAKEEKNAAE